MAVHLNNLSLDMYLVAGFIDDDTMEDQFVSSSLVTAMDSQLLGTFSGKFTTQPMGGTDCQWTLMTQKSSDWETYLFSK